MTNDFFNHEIPCFGARILGVEPFWRTIPTLAPEVDSQKFPEGFFLSVLFTGDFHCPGSGFRRSGTSRSAKLCPH